MVSQNGAILALDNVSVNFGGLMAVNEFTFTLQKGELAGLIGPNGAGKTTIFNIITGQYEPVRGKVFFKGQDITGWRPDRVACAGIARTFQNIRLFEDLTVLDNVLVSRHSKLKASVLAAALNLPGYINEERVAREKAMELLDRVGLADLANAEAGSLPYGQQRRVEIARALAADPELLLLDEPAAGMNPEETSRLMEFICDVRDKFGLTILLIEHDMKLVMGICERIRVIDYGVSIAEGTPQEIQSDSRVITAYLGEEACEYS
ncbi:MAG: ABC transporter ATP-binding protein [Bacillota bacterium]|jgi:branched-chain amino acid transport system ATP-binding protein|nr:ABC transporter ATP-binding protein [Bacillota bacterium]MDI9414447.1 ABC transporter ATP-binding protein [Bacillota bacterium]NLD12386.1 ABC transporter ATP-binding protein [Bacillota bacterium]HCD41133.1 high-affinity branched-chain amino acid ABC transporter ATP-binding protein LivG [Bacillota bacterium]HOB89313.1 ABC transporter ATP-binding protein [Bacillota bacterium]